MWSDHNPKKIIIVRMVATMVVMSFVFRVGIGNGPLGATVAVATFLCGAAYIVVNGVSLWKLRSDPYDLTKLRLVDDRVESEQERGEHPVLYCHRCDISVPDNYSICPQCGCHLGT